MYKRHKTKQQRSSDRAKRKARYGAHWNEIRQRVYERDGMRCRACGKGNIKLNAHHVLLLRVSQTNDMRNLITLCDECHMLVEARALRMLKSGQHRTDVVRMTFRWLQECKEKRQQELLEEINAEPVVSSDTRQDSQNP
jgi:hypothetical protein